MFFLEFIKEGFSIGLWLECGVSNFLCVVFSLCFIVRCGNLNLIFLYFDCLIWIGWYLRFYFFFEMLGLVYMIY